MNTYNQKLRTSLKGMAVAFLVIMPLFAASVFFGSECLKISPGDGLIAALGGMMVFLMIAQNLPAVSTMPIWKKAGIAMLGYGLSLFSIYTLGIPGKYIGIVLLVASVLLLAFVVYQNRKPPRDERDRLIAEKVKRVHATVGFVLLMLGIMAIYFYSDYVGEKKFDTEILISLLTFSTSIAALVSLLAGKYYYRKLGTESDD